MATKQHELLAIEGDINGKTNKMLDETSRVFGDSSKFDEFTKTYAAFDEDDKDIPETEKKLMTTTVDERIKYLAKSITASINILATKEKTNTVACADIIVRDEDDVEVKKIAEAVPVSALLQLEKRFTEYRKLYSKIPTFNTEMHWINGTNAQGNACYVEKDSRKRSRTVTETINESFNPNPVPGADKFKLETRQVEIKKTKGEYTTVTKTGRLSPKEKSDLLARLDQILAAIKRARSQANNIDVVEMNIGKDIMNFINS